MQLQFIFLCYNNAMNNLKEFIKFSAYEKGIDLIGFAKARNFTEFEQFYNEKIKNNYLSDVGNIRDVKKRLNVFEVMPHAKTIIAVGVSYNKNIDKPEDEYKKGIISHHVFKTDYHTVMQEKMRNLIEKIKEKAGDGCKFQYYCDNGTLDDRIAAYLAGIGFFGKNNFIINEKYGSYIFLGHILTDLALESDNPAKTLCNDCRACIDSCPNGAIVDSYCFNAKKCISNLTQKKVLSDMEKQAIGRHIYGCNICQQACRFNISAPVCNEKNFCAETDDVYVDCDNIINMDEEAFKEKYKNTAMYWRGYEIIMRNASVAKENIGRNLNINNDGGKYES